MLLFTGGAKRHSSITNQRVFINVAVVGFSVVASRASPGLFGPTESMKQQQYARYGVKKAMEEKYYHNGLSLMLLLL